MHVHKAEVVRCWKSLLLEISVKKRKCSFYNQIIVEFRLTNIEEMMEFESHHMATMGAVIVWSKNHQWMLKLTGENIMKNKIFIQSQSIFPQVTNDSREIWQTPVYSSDCN